jgi:hypothetical protein
MSDSDIHDKLMIAFRTYFEASEKWESTDYDYPGIRARNALGEIRILARQRRMEIQRLRKVRRAKKKGKVNE